MQRVVLRNVSPAVKTARCFDFWRSEAQGREHGAARPPVRDETGGDLIVYGNMGVCRVEAVEAPAGLPGAGEKKLYYKLDPVYETGTVYIPVDAKVFMRPILTHAQAEALIGRIPEIEENPCGGKDQQMLAEHYRSLMRTHDCDDLVQLIKTIYGKNRERTAQGKKPARTEAEYMKRAEELLHGELAAALGITPEQVPGYIAAEVAQAGCGAET